MAKIWCMKCRKWHEISDSVSSWDDIAQLENWGCVLDMYSIFSEGRGVE